VVTGQSENGRRSRRSSVLGDIEAYPSVAAALEAIRLSKMSSTETTVDLTNSDLSAKYATLERRYIETIDRCRELLRAVQDTPAAPHPEP